MSHLVFVYGTLRKGFRNHHFMKEEKLICDGAQSIKKGELLLFYDRPFIRFDQQKYSLKGEIYEVSDKTLVELDKLEVHPEWYLRVEEKFQLATSSEELTAFCYILNNAPEKDFCKPYHKGCYRDYMKDYKGDTALEYEIINNRIQRIIK